MTEDWLARFRRYGAVQEGHFLLSSGLHSGAYVQSALILQHPDEAEALGRALADLARPLRPDLVIGPALGAVIVAHEVGRALRVRALFAERADGRLALRRGFAVAPGERALIVEDVITTGGSTAEVAALVRQAGGVVAGVAALVDRTGGRRTFEVPLQALLTLDLPAFPAGACPLCRAGVPATKPGSRPG
ncbi:MAG: orotate phosphoribosyltransferase [Armatimonadota bacterium]|nr:orotate phosphoribosyltransferase [Armatimonadota bacterium]MDR7518510.1 orotate phosphoribosyltransferase [Armatimonadota bacterium]MDR7549397.1 orotate phosphoribosyltransferase [Armatimonadota bacterium]